MSKLNKLPFLDTVILAALCAVGLFLRLLPGTIPVIFKVRKTGSQGGAAYFSMSVIRVSKEKKACPFKDWSSIPYDIADPCPDKSKRVIRKVEGERDFK
jgi:hypothetical protein